MTRTHKFNDRDHTVEGDHRVQEHLPKFFAKAGFVDTDPKKTKKDGGGKGNWGTPGTEIEDIPVNMNNARRRSNSSTATRGAQAFKSKFEVVEAEPVFEDMPPEEHEEESHIRLEQQSTTSSSESQSIDELEH
jgi:hypothetical protein